MPALVNGEPGFVIRIDSDRPQDAEIAVYGFSVRAGRIEAMYGVLAPDKTTRVPPPEQLEDPAMPTVSSSAPARPSPRTPGNTPPPS